MTDLDKTEANTAVVQTASQKIQSYFLIGVLTLSLVLVFLIFRPYIPVFLFALVLAVIFNPVHNWIYSKVNQKQFIASLLSTLLIVAIFMIPLAIFGSLLFKELSGALPSLTSENLHNIHLPKALENLNISLENYVTGAVGNFTRNLGTLLSDVVKIFVFLGLTILSLIYLFKDGGHIAESLFDGLPFTKAQSEKLKFDMATGIRAIIGGYILVAIIQGIMSGIGFWFFGIPNPALWAFVTIIAALIPTFGTSLVNIPAVIFLFFNNQSGHAIGLLIWYVLAVSLIDNFIGPKFISGRVNIHILLIIFSIIGGIQFFGAIGFILGPLVTIFSWSILEIFQNRTQDPELQQPAEVNIKLEK